MSIQVWKPFDEFKSITREMNRLLNEFSVGRENEESMNGSVWTPRVNIAESKDSYTIELDLPGIKKKDIKINMVSNMLQIEGERKYSEKESDKNWVRRESYCGKFFRSFSLPKDVDLNKTDAEFNDGVLTVKMAKLEEAKPKEISINVK